MCCFDVKNRLSEDNDKYHYIPEVIQVKQKSSSLRSSRIMDVITPTELEIYRLSLIESDPIPPSKMHRAYTCQSSVIITKQSSRLAKSVLV